LPVQLGCSQSSWDVVGSMGPMESHTFQGSSRTLFQAVFGHYKNHVQQTYLKASYGTSFATPCFLVLKNVFMASIALFYSSVHLP